MFLLRHRDYELTIVEEGAKFGRDVNPFYLWGYTKILREKKATLLRASHLVTVTGKEARITGTQGERNIEIDGIIVALRERAGLWAQAELANEVFLVGDAKRPRRLQNAIHDGYRLGMKL